MSSQLTRGMVRAQLYSYVDPSNPNSPLFDQRLNEVIERFTNSGTWKGCIVEAVFPTDTDGRIVLPYYIDSILAGTLRGVPAPVYTTFHMFTEVGPGYILPNNQTGIPFFDLGDKFPTETEIPAGSYGVLRTTISDAGDVGKVNRYFGLDENGDEIFDAEGNRGEQVILANPTVDTVNQFSRVTGVQKQESLGMETLAWMDGATPTTLSTYYPTETVPLRHAYQIGTVNEDPTYAEKTLACLCRRRYVPLTADTDFVIPGNLGAIKFGLLALNAESAPADNMRETAKRYWADAYQLLDQQHKATRGGARSAINYQPQGWGIGAVRNSF